MKVKDFIRHLVKWQRAEFIHRDVWFGMGNIIQPELLPADELPPMSCEGSSIVASSPIERDAQCKSNGIYCNCTLICWLVKCTYLTKLLNYMNLQGWQKSKSTTRNPSSFTAEIPSLLIG